MLLAASLANDWPVDRADIIARTREFDMTMPYARTGTDDHDLTRINLIIAVDNWFTIVDESDHNHLHPYSHKGLRQFQTLVGV